ncbi:MAG: RluA family pseudouridine synthase [Rikenellaceae bacterium]
MDEPLNVLQILMPLIHPLEVDREQLPERLNTPFNNQPPRYADIAAVKVRELLEELQCQYPTISAELKLGKMVGFLVIEHNEGVGMLAAFSGSLAGRYTLPNFVPPIYDLDSPHSHFRAIEKQITAINNEIKRRESSDELKAARERTEEQELRAKEQLKVAKEAYKEAQQLRERRRAEGSEDISIINRESQHQKGELRRLKQSVESEVKRGYEIYNSLLSEINNLKDRRAELSNILQREIFESYIVMNGYGEQRSIYDIFIESRSTPPPSATGECAAPKLLHYALSHSLRPLSIGEFWVGESPKGEVRHDGEFYEACVSRCHPLLNYMLQGVDYQREDSQSREETIEIIYEDNDLIVIDKPSGLLSIAGRKESHCVESIIRAKYPELNCSIMVHRLDQDTSGVMVVAKSDTSHRELQRQFASREVHKIYIADVKGVVSPEQGEIDLPISADYENRPRQRIDHERGKEARTIYRVVKCDGITTRLELRPQNGRTHQLRIHCASSEGLSTPIIGDQLYGHNETESIRLHLHAQQLEFTHPVTGRRLQFISKKGAEWL